MNAMRWLATLVLVGCAPSRDEPRFEAKTPLPWVNPARCLASCAHRDERALVTIDLAGRPSVDGGFRLAAEAQPALAAMIAEAASESFTLTVGSAYRTYEEQAALWGELSPTQPGRAARPGHSEHEAGLAVDLGFAPGVDAQAWTAENAWRFGFVLSYPQHEQKTTGFNFEPWHYRFVGSDVAAQLHAQPGLTLEELFQRTPGLGVSGDCADCPLDSSRSTCATVTPEGACDAQVLRWCFSGAASAVDCAASSLRCHHVDGGADCVEP